MTWEELVTMQPGDSILQEEWGESWVLLEPWKVTRRYDDELASARTLWLGWANGYLVIETTWKKGEGLDGFIRV